METGIHAMPFSVEAKFSIVDLNDLAEATGIVATSDGHESATYQLAGPEQLSQTNMAHILSGLRGKTSAPKPNRWKILEKRPRFLGYLQPELKPW